MKKKALAMLMAVMVTVGSSPVAAAELGSTANT